MKADAVATCAAHALALRAVPTDIESVLRYTGASTSCGNRWQATGWVVRREYELGKLCQVHDRMASRCPERWTGVQALFAQVATSTIVE
jgi:hypothetical protein